MAYTFRGIGALHYGKREFRPDGSYITTLWVVCFYVPVVPISSKRIGPIGEVKYYGIRPRSTMKLYEKTKPNGIQVLSVYAWWATMLAILITAKVEKVWWLAIPGVAVLGLPWLVRRRATERMKDGAMRQEMGLSPEISE